MLFHLMPLVRLTSNLPEESEFKVAL